MNELLRSHVQRVGFDLSLTRGQVEVLVFLDLVGDDAERSNYRGRQGLTLAISQNFVGAAKGLGRRGLVTHHYDEAELRGRFPGYPARRNVALSNFYTITSAGYCVLDLLREAGIYEDVERIVCPERFTATGKRRSARVAS